MKGCLVPIACGFIWCVLWVPLGLFVFESHPHAPTALVAPLFGPLSLWEADAWSGNWFWQSTLPCLVFWLVLFAVVGGAAVAGASGSVDRVADPESRGRAGERDDESSNGRSGDS